MSGYRIGDRDVEIAGQSYRLRLTVSALAEIASVFEAESPKACLLYTSPSPRD